MKPSWNYEQLYWKEGIEVVAGVDEAGMGAWAGPVVAGAVIFEGGRNDQTPMTNDQIRDSKALSAKRREEVGAWIQENALAWGIGEASAAEIDKLNIRQAAHLAMWRAIEKLTRVPDLLLID